MASKLTLDGGIALVTGAASGIGKETALAFAEAGAKGVIFADINDEGVEAVAEESKKYAQHAKYRALPIKVDASDTESVQSLITTAVKEFGRIDYAVNSAGIELESYGGTFCQRGYEGYGSAGTAHISWYWPSWSTQPWKRFDRPPRFHFLPERCTWNDIFTTAKHAIIGIMRSAAVDALALQSAIRVNAVCPGWVDTPMVENGVQKNPMLDFAIKNMTPLKRAATVDEVADYIVFLSSPSASYINGTALPIDAGLTLPAPPALPQD